jgi:uncharacterized protein (TIGR03086 family)
MPADELESADMTFAVLADVVAGITADDLDRQTPCRKFDVAGLTDHLMNSITVIGGAVGAGLPPRDGSAPVPRQIGDAARPALDAWRAHGLDGMVPFGDGEAPARMMAGILSLEFLVHAWDYAAALDRDLAVPDALAAYVDGVARQIITPQGRTKAGFDDPIEVPDDASAMARLLAFTGRRG